MKTNKKFDSSKVIEYWKNQIPPTNLSEKYVDPYFPPNTASLMGLDQYGNIIDPINGPIHMKDIKVEDIEWKSIVDIFDDNFLIFENKIEMDDIKQGNLGNCYLLSAISALTEFPNFIYQIFRSKEKNKYGYYEVVLYIDGEWQIVFVDDYFPFSKESNELKFCKPNGNEMWALILEKAWAKINGGYALIIAGWPSDPLVALTGFPCQKIHNSEESIEDLWISICGSDKENEIMCCNTTSNPDIQKQGLIVNHAYTLISAKQKDYENNYKKSIKLVKLRNPWGYKEWIGKFSDNSELWTDDLKEYFSGVSKDDGTFYMAIDDYHRFFSNTQICHIVYGSNSRSFFLKDELLFTPLFFILNTDRDANFNFSLIFQHWRYNRNFVDANHPATIIVAKLEEESGKFTIRDIYGEYSSKENPELFAYLSKGTYFVWTFVDIKNCYPNPNKVIFRIISSIDYAVSFYGHDYYFLLLRKIFLEGLKNINLENIKNSEGVYHQIMNSFRKSGIGYQIISNKFEDKSLLIEWDSSKIEGLSMLPPFNKTNTKYQLVLRPNSSTVILAFRNNQGSHWLNIKKTITDIDNHDEYISIVEDLDEDNLKVMLEKNINPVVDPYFYDITMPTKEEIFTTSNFNFKSINIGEATLNKYKNKYPEYFNTILALDPIKSDLNLIWAKFKLKNGFYVGEVNEGQRHGRGVFCFDDGNHYIGYWEFNQRNIYGKFFNSNKKLIYDGKILNGVKHGNGIQHFENGGRYEGEFENDLKCGKGVYYFPNGSHWEGLFKNNQMSGEGLFFSKDNLVKKVMRYENGKLV